MIAPVKKAFMTPALEPLVDAAIAEHFHGLTETESTVIPCSCGSSNTYEDTREYETGVSGPGGRERWTVHVVVCEDCGAVEEL